MRLIDADKIVFDYSRISYIAPSDGTGIAKYFADQIKYAPTITPESLVVHGRWIKLEDGTCYCSNCRKNPEEWFERALEAFYFCPNCGCKMDLEETNEN